MSEIFEFASIGPNQGLTIRILLYVFILFHSCGHVLTPKLQTARKLFGIVTAFCKLVP